jgi:hypothetical protein
MDRRQPGEDKAGHAGLPLCSTVPPLEAMESRKFGMEGVGSHFVKPTFNKSAVKPAACGRPAWRLLMAGYV